MLMPIPRCISKNCALRHESTNATGWSHYLSRFSLERLEIRIHRDASSTLRALLAVLCKTKPTMYTVMCTMCFADRISIYTYSCFGSANGRRETDPNRNILCFSIAGQWGTKENASDSLQHRHESVLQTSNRVRRNEAVSYRTRLEKEDVLPTFHVANLPQSHLREGPLSPDYNTNEHT